MTRRTRYSKKRSRSITRVFENHLRFRMALFGISVRRAFDNATAAIGRLGAALLSTRHERDYGRDQEETDS